MNLQRLRALVWKELLQVGRDPSSVLIAFVLPLVLLFIFGYGLSLDSKNVPIGVVVEQPSADASEFVSALDGSDYLEVHLAHDTRTLEADLIEGELRGIVIVPEDFARNLAAGHAEIRLIADGSEPNIASFVDAYLRGALQHWQEMEAVEHGIQITPAITVDQRVWFNPSVTSRHFLVPGSIAIILTVVGALLTALVIAREWERGTMEALLASPVTRMELLLGKVIPYFLLGLASLTLCVVVAVFLFQVPLRGSLLALYTVSGIFLLGGLGLGLAISAAAKNQFLASQVAINAAFLPAFMLSGFIFEIRSMPTWIQYISRLVPARYYVDCLKTLFLAGDLWGYLLPRIIALTVIAVFLLALTAKNLKRHLD
ncbi:MAG: antibiotic transport system permease protein [Puniceicoccaceae bacterium 5H]|nr:MAG: antibiotic transport system permease protein [Puniceicoccaceae bacterium 5H]